MKITGFDLIVVPCDFLSFFVVFYSLIRSVIYTKNIKKEGIFKMENTFKKEETKTEDMCKEECKVYKNWVDSINKSLSPFAVKYYMSDCIADKARKGCPFETKGKKVTEMSDEQIEVLKEMYQYYKITPPYVWSEQPFEKKKARLMSEFTDIYRLHFAREEERIMFTEAFRRLQYKTQVMVNSVSDDQRTRLLHSLEVQKIARRIAVALGANKELTEAIALGHDIGHAPFGHAGESAIDRFLQDNLAGRFSHALQSVKVIDYLCSHRYLKPYGLKGLGISDYVLEDILKHDSDSYLNNLSKAGFKLQYDCSDLYRPVGPEWSEERFKNNKVYVGGLESQIVYWADKIAYKGHDWEEFVSVGLFEKMLERVNNIVIQMYRFVDMYDYNKRTFSKEFKMEGLYEEEIQIIRIITGSLSELRKNFEVINNKYKEAYKKHRIEDEVEEGDEAKDPKDLIEKEIKEKHKEEIMRLLDAFIDSLENSKQSVHNKKVYFSREEYDMLCDYFKIAKAFVEITDDVPEVVGEKMDIIYILYNFMIKKTSHNITPVLAEKLINSSRVRINDFLKEIENKYPKKAKHKSPEAFRQEFLSKCNKAWSNPQKTPDKQLLLLDSFMVTFEQEQLESINEITRFINEQYIKSTRIKYMTCTAEKIIFTLLDFYHKNYHMLPLKQRKLIEAEIEREKIYNKVSDLLFKYYVDFAEEKGREVFLESLFNKLRNKENIEILKREDGKVDERTISAIREGLSIDFMFELRRVLKDYPELVYDIIVLRIIADYVSGMTDRMAEKKYNEILSSSTNWSKEYSEVATFNM